ncbi:MAG: MFS transporter [Candidatus Methylomirabilales bacterium]
MRPIQQDHRTLLTVFVTLAITYGVWYSYSVYLVALVGEFGWSRSLVAGAFSFFLLVHGAVGPLAGWALRRMGARAPIAAGAGLVGAGLLLAAETDSWWHLYGAFGFITAVGMGLCGWIPAVVLVRGWFPRRVGTAMGIASAGIGVGILAMIPFTQLLIDGWGWRWAFRFQAVMTVAWVVPATCWLVRDPPEPPPATGKRSGPSPRAWTLAMAVRTPRFWGLAAGYFVANFVTQMLLVHQVAYLVDHGVAPLTAATVGGAVGLVSIGGKIGWGLLSDRRGREVAVTLAFACVAASVGALVLAGRVPAPPALYLYALLIGLGYSVLSAVFPAVAADLYGGPGFSTIYGSLYTIICIGLASGAWFAGKTFDLTGSYAIALWVGLLMALATPAIFWWVVAPRRANPPPAGRSAGSRF